MHQCTTGSANLSTCTKREESEPQISIVTGVTLTFRIRAHFDSKLTSAISPIGTCLDFQNATFILIIKPRKQNGRRIILLSEATWLKVGWRWVVCFPKALSQVWVWNLVSKTGCSVQTLLLPFADWVALGSLCDLSGLYSKGRSPDSDCVLTFKWDNHLYILPEDPV